MNSEVLGHVLSGIVLVALPLSGFFARELWRLVRNGPSRNSGVDGAILANLLERQTAILDRQAETLQAMQVMLAEMNVKLGLILHHVDPPEGGK